MACVAERLLAFRGSSAGRPSASGGRAPPPMRIGKTEARSARSFDRSIRSTSSERSTALGNERLGQPIGPYADPLSQSVSPAAHRLARCASIAGEARLAAAPRQRSSLNGLDCPAEPSTDKFARNSAKTPDPADQAPGIRAQPRRETDTVANHPPIFHVRDSAGHIGQPTERHLRFDLARAELDQTPDAPSQIRPPAAAKQPTPFETPQSP